MRPSGAIVLLLLTVIQSACATTKVDDRPVLYDGSSRNASTERARIDSMVDYLRSVQQQ
jgi:hypothetical protein